jgi:hypothetical protein
VKLTDDDAGESTDSKDVTVNNVDPVVISVNFPAAPFAVNTVVTGFTGTFTDVGTLDTHTAKWSWGDTMTTDVLVTQLTEPSGSTAGSVTGGSHTYTAASLYIVSLTVTDDDTGTDTEAIVGYVVVYDPSAGFVTGGGWIDSPAGAYRPDTSLTGKATFGFVSQYKKGRNSTSGQH